MGLGAGTTETLHPEQIDWTTFCDEIYTKNILFRIMHF